MCTILWGRLHFVYDATLFFPGRIFYNILVLTFSLLLQIFRYNVYKCIYLTLYTFSFEISESRLLARVELKCVQYSEGDYILCMTSRYFFRSFTNVRLLCFVSHSNGMKSCQRSSAENVSCNVAPFFHHHTGDTTSCIRQATFANFKGKRI
jgi:hypothetical protein